MEAFAFSSLTTITATSLAVNRLLFPSFSSRIGIRRRKCGVSFSVVASKEDDTKLDKWEQMELKFGRLLGEDPKLTLAKIMGRRANPDVSYIEIEKSFHKNKGKLVDIEEVPLDWEEEKRSSLDGLNLVRPVPKKGIKFEASDKPVAPEGKKPSQFVGNKMENTNKGKAPNVILRKPTMFNENDVQDKPFKFKLQPNLSLRMRTGQSKDKFSDMTLLRKPEPVIINLMKKKESSSSKVDDESIGNGNELKVMQVGYDDFSLLKRPEVKAKLEEKPEPCGNVDAAVTVATEEKTLHTTATTDATKSEIAESVKIQDGSALKGSDAQNDIGLQPLKQSTEESAQEVTALGGQSDEDFVDSTVQFSLSATLRGKPQRLDQSAKETSKPSSKETVLASTEGFKNSFVLKSLPSSALEDADWNRAEDLLKRREKSEVELISSSTRGFVVSLGSLIGFLPYRNLAAKWKFLAFESWLRQMGFDPSMYRQNLGVIESQKFKNENSSLDSSQDSEMEKQFKEKLSPDMKLEDLLRIYDQEKLKFLSSFIGQRIKVNVVMADKISRKLVVSMRPKEKEELVEKKRNLMAKLRVGDVVKSCIKKISYFGIFVEVEGVSALIHQTEVSWDATLDPAMYFKIGQIVEAKVHLLDFALERIFLSLKQITPDPLAEALESVVGDRKQLDEGLEVAQADTEWADVESLVKELQQIEGIQLVSKGRFFLSPGLAPTFQVYMAPIFENQYKLLARAGNKVQEVMVQASLDKEEMKSTILSCTNRVE